MTTIDLTRRPRRTFRVDAASAKTPCRDARINIHEHSFLQPRGTRNVRGDKRSFIASRGGSMKIRGATPGRTWPPMPPAVASPMKKRGRGRKTKTKRTRKKRPGRRLPKKKGRGKPAKRTTSTMTNWTTTTSTMKNSTTKISTMKNSTTKISTTKISTTKISTMRISTTTMTMMTTKTKTMSPTRPSDVLSPGRCRWVAAFFSFSDCVPRGGSLYSPIDD